MDIFLIVSLMLLLLAAKAFFSGSEIGLVNADRLKLYHQANKGNQGAQLVLRLMRRPERLLGTTLVGTNLCVVALTTLGTILMIRFFGTLGDLAAFLIFSPIFLMFGEVVPKSVFQQKAEVLAPRIIYPLRLFSWLFYPIVAAFSWIARMVSKAVGVTAVQRDLFVNREQIRSVIEMADRGANVDLFDRERILRVVRYAGLSVGDVMIPMSEVSTLSLQSTARDVVQAARSKACFRMPVYEGEQNQIIGVVSLTIWDLMDAELQSRPFTELVKAAYFVPENQSLDELLPVLQSRADHMAIVVDEFGSAVGMVTIEDVLEVVVGDVVNVGYSFEGHLPRRKYQIEKCGDDEYVVDGRTSVTELSELLDTTLSVTGAHTIGGMIIAQLRHIPQRGESILDANYLFTVEASDERGVQRVRVSPVGK